MVGGVMGALVVTAYFLGRTQVNTSSPQVESAQSPAVSKSVETPTFTPDPTLTPAPAVESISQNTTEENDCANLIVDLYEQYNNIYTVDDILLADNKECHYFMLRRLGLTVNDGHIRDQADELSKTYPSYQSVPQYEAPQPQTPSFSYEEYQAEQDAKCVEDTTKYNLCMSEYNADMAEYNSCLSRKLDNPYLYCSKPYKYCYKPVCAALW